MEPPLLDHEEAVPTSGAQPTHLMWGAGLIASAIAVALVAGVIVARYPFGFDRAIVLALHEAGPEWLRHAVIDVTALGGGTVLTLVVAATAGLLLVRRLWLTAALVVTATTLGGIAVAAIKAIFGRPRPDIVDHVVVASGYSFPSGHAANSAIVWLTVAALVSQGTRRAATTPPSPRCWSRRSGRAGCISASTGRPTCWRGGASGRCGRSAGGQSARRRGRA